jgi:hypothetical protein
MESVSKSFFSQRNIVIFGGAALLSLNGEIVSDVAHCFPSMWSFMRPCGSVDPFFYGVDGLVSHCLQDCIK